MFIDQGGRVRWIGVSLIACLASGCQDAPETRATTMDSAVSPQPSATSPLSVSPESAAIARFREQLPPEVLVRTNACPFECCVYGPWLADTVIPMYPTPRAAGAPAFQFTKGTRMNADSGVVYITSLALAVVDDTVFRYADRKPWLLPGDTLVLLEPVGEGYWTMWRRGEVLKEVPPFFENIPEPKAGHLVGKPGREWWVHATAHGRRGWFPMDRVRVRGADACGGPIDG